MSYLLDTNVCIAHLRRAPSPVSRHLQRLAPPDVAVPTIVVYELTHGAERSSRPDHNRTVVQRFLQPFQVLPFDVVDAEEAGRIRAELEGGGNVIGPYDLLIAGQARARGLTLVTNNVREFGRVRGMIVEDWTLA